MRKGTDKYFPVFRLRGIVGLTAAFNSLLSVISVPFPLLKIDHLAVCLPPPALPGRCGRLPEYVRQILRRGFPAMQNVIQERLQQMPSLKKHERKKVNPSF